MSQVLTANDAFKVRSNRVLEAGLIAGAILHLLAFALVPPRLPPDRAELIPIEPMVHYPLAPEFEIPPPPPEPARPTLPVPGSIASLAEPAPLIPLPAESTPFPWPEAPSALPTGEGGTRALEVAPVLLHRVIPTYPPWPGRPAPRARCGSRSWWIGMVG